MILKLVMLIESHPLRVDVGGKGINVSKVIKELQYKSLALGFVGGNSGNQIKDYLKDSNIDNDFLL